MVVKSKEKVVVMTNMRNVIAWCVAMVFAVVSWSVVAQEDLDSLLKDLESDSGEKVSAPAKAEAKTAAKPEVEAKAETAAKPEVEVEAKAEEVIPEAEEATEEKAEEKAEAEAKAEDEVEAKAETEAKAEDEVEAKVEAKVEEKAEEAQPAKADVAAATAPGDAELIENIRNTELVRRKALDVQAKREIVQARQSMKDEEYDEAVRHYGLALKLLNDRQSSRDFRKECDQGIAEGLYRAALQEYDIGRRELAYKRIQQAIDMRHPKARRVLELWNAASAGDEETTEAAGNAHRLNDADYKKDREQIRRHLRRSRQYLAVKDLRKALEECEIVLVNDPYNREAIRLRKAIQAKRHVILQQERVQARDGMIADVDERWRPVYAPNAAKLKDAAAETVKAQTGDDPERTAEQEIERRMKAMRLPTISFKPPATIIEAVDFFRTASKDYDDPKIPIERRGFNFYLKTPQGAIKAQAAAEDTDDFSNNDAVDATESGNGLPPIPTITASDITFYEALKLVCDSVDYKFVIRDSVVMVMHKDMSTAEILARKYNVPEAFIERVSSASEEIKTMGGFGSDSAKKGGDDGEENQERDWMTFFEQMGVKWPKGSSIKHIKSLGKLYVRNTRENLAEFEKVLDELGGQPQLIEIETRFVEVKQEDLNSLGFEWILNSDYSLDVGHRLSKALGISGSEWGSASGSKAWSRNSSESGSTVSGSTSSSSQWSSLDSLSKNGGKASNLTESGALSGNNTTMNSTLNQNNGWTFTDSYQRTVPYVSKNGNLIRDVGGKKNIGLNAFGGTDATYGNGNRYLSQTGNHISGSDASSNDQFMRVNAFLGQADLSLILHMLSQRSDTDLLSAPKVVTKSGENAVIKVVIEYIYPQDYDVQLQSSGSSSGGSNSGSSQSAILAVVEPQNFTMREVGVILDVTPTYSEANGGTIDLELKPQVVDEPVWHNYGMKIPFTGNTGSASAVPDFAGIISAMTASLQALAVPLSDDDRTQIGGRVVDTSMNAINNLSTAGSQNMTWYDAPMEQPFFPVRSIDSKVSITPGSTVVMGGLITEARKAMDDKVPFLGDLPFVGRLFRSHAEQTIKKNLLIFVTGRLITPSGRELAVNEESSETEAEVKAAPKAD